MLHPLRRKNFMSKAPWRASIAAMRAIATMSSLAAIGLCRRARVTHWRRHAGRAGKGTLEVGESELQQAHCTNCEAAPPGSQHAGLMPTWSQPRKSKSPASAFIALRSGCAPVVDIILLLGPGPGRGPHSSISTKNKNGLQLARVRVPVPKTEGKRIPLRQGHSVQEALLRHPTAGRNGEHDGTERQRTVRRARADDENRLSLWTCLVDSQRGLQSMMAGHSKSRCWRTNSNFSSIPGTAFLAV